MRSHQEVVGIMRRWVNQTRRVLRKLKLEVSEDRTLLTSGLRVISVTPLEIRNNIFDHIDVKFNTAIDPATAEASDVSLTGPQGSIPISGVTAFATETYRLSFTALTALGTYHAAIGPDIADTQGHLMDQDQDGIPGELSSPLRVAPGHSQPVRRSRPCNRTYPSPTQPS